MPELLARVVPESLSVLMLLLILSASMSALAVLVLIPSSAVLGLTVCVGLYAAGRPSPEAGTLGMMTSLGVAPVASLAAPALDRRDR
jgi:hypothetical protein